MNLTIFWFCKVVNLFTKFPLILICENYHWNLMVLLSVQKEVMFENEQQWLLYSQPLTLLSRDCHWLIPGHVALTKIKCIPIEYLYPTWDTTTYAQSMMESAVTGGRKNSLPVFIFVNTQSLTVAVSRFHLEKQKYLQDQETNNIYLRKVTTHTTKGYHFFRALYGSAKSVVNTEEFITSDKLIQEWIFV